MPGVYSAQCRAHSRDLIRAHRVTPPGNRSGLRWDYVAYSVHPAARPSAVLKSSTRATGNRAGYRQRLALRYEPEPCNRQQCRGFTRAEWSRLWSIRRKPSNGGACRGRHCHRGGYPLPYTTLTEFGKIGIVNETGGPTDLICKLSRFSCRYLGVRYTRSVNKQ